MKSKSLCRTKPRGEKIWNVLKPSKAKEDVTELCNLETSLSAPSLYSSTDYHMENLAINQNEIKKRFASLSAIM